MANPTKFPDHYYENEPGPDRPPLTPQEQQSVDERVKKIREQQKKKPTTD